MEFWIKLHGSLTNGRPILQKLEGSAINEMIPRPAYGFRARTVPGERLELTLTSNDATATYTGTKSVPVNEWVNVAVTVPQLTAPAFYWNGTADTVVTVGSDPE